MSLYLGKIHYWLFNKIVWFEGLENEIINLAKDEILDIEELSKEINGKYGTQLPNIPLENMIDQGNIHGWLQSKIHSAEGRMAAWTSKVLEDNNKLSKIENIYINQGIKAAKEVKENKVDFNSAVDIFNSINDYILDGMPCDRVNEVIESEENIIKWKRRVCVHKEIWNKEGVDVNCFYALRGLWIKAFVNELNEEFSYKEENEIMIIEKI
ncbi:hypothetical protein JCM1393_22770 [Clostridium carnis]